MKNINEDNKIGQLFYAPDFFTGKIFWTIMRDDGVEFKLDQFEHVADKLRVFVDNKFFKVKIKSLDNESGTNPSLEYDSLGIALVCLIETDVGTNTEIDLSSMCSESKAEQGYPVYIFMND